MDAKERLKAIFHIDFEEKESIMAVRQYWSKNTFCTNEEGDIIAIFSSENDYTDIVIPATLSKLQYLNVCDNTQLKSLVFESALPELWHFDASDSGLEAIKFPAGFERLRWLDVSRNKLGQIEMEGRFPALEYLDLSGNQVEALHIPDCPGLVDVYAQSNTLKEFSITSAATALRQLNLKENQLEDLPRNLPDLKQLVSLYVHGNPLSNLSSVIISEEEYGNSLEAVMNYLKELEKATIINDRAKLIIVGNGRVGKTSIRHRLYDDTFNEDEKYTHGIEFGTLSKTHLPRVKTESLQLQVWDFGGQEIFYATHQFFLTEEAVYLLAWTDEANVIAYREKDKEALPFDEKWRSCEYWLENIRLHGQKSPILMVQTHSDKLTNKQPEDPEWNEKYQAQPLSFSAKEKFGLEELKFAISECLNNNIPLLGKEFPRSYDNVIADIAYRKEHETHITRDQFFALCNSVGIEKGSEHLLLDYLKKAGLVVYFDKPLLKDTVYIDPNWLTEQVYKLINNKLRPRGGQIDQDYLEQILPAEDGYSPEMRAQFVALLQAFELIFQPEGEDFFIAPQYLPEKLSAREQKFHDKLLRSLSDAFVFRFPKFLPDNVMINFLSRYGPYSDQIYWRDGISFTSEDEVDCIVHFDPDQHSLHVYSGASEGAMRLQREICQSFIKLSKNAYAEISVDGEHFVPWQRLEKQFELLAENPKQRMLTADGKADVAVMDFVRFWDKGDIRVLPRHKSRALVAQARFEEALEELSNQMGEDSKSTIAQLQQRLNTLQKARDAGTISYEDANLEQNKISEAILNLCTKL